MRWQKYVLLTLITLSLTICESFAVNLKLKFLDSTAVAQIEALLILCSMKYPSAFNRGL